MPSEVPTSDSIDPLRGISGLMLFPRTIKAATDVPAPADARDLESIHNFVKSLELRSPEKLINEAKIIVDGGVESLDYNLAKFTENVAIPVAVASKGEDRPREQRQGLGLARKRRPFSLKSYTSQPSVCLESTLDVSNLEDPDEFFDACERMEKANKEIQKQMGNMAGIENYRPSNNARRRPRPGILGKTYRFKHQYPSEPSENAENDRLMLSLETIDQDITGTPQDESHEKLVHLNPIPCADVEEVETTVSTKKTENEVSGLLEELLSRNIEDLEGDGALNLLQERLKIKPLDLESLSTVELPGVRTYTFTVTERDLGSTSVPTATEHSQKHKKSSPDIGSVLKNLSRKFMKQELVASTNNPSSSRTPPRSPFTLISSLQKRISQPYPLKDQFSPTNVDLFAHQNSSAARSKNELLDQIAPPKDLSLSNELELCVEVDNRELEASNVGAEREMGVAYGGSNQFVDENATNEEVDIAEKMSADEVAGKSYPSMLENEICDNTLNRSPVALISSLQKRISPHPLKDQFSPANANLSMHQNSSHALSKHKLLDQIAPPKDLSLPNELELCEEVDNREPVVSYMDAERELGVALGVPNLFVDENASATNKDVRRPNEEPDIADKMSVDEGKSYPPEHDLGSARVPTTEHLEKHKKSAPDIGSVLSNLSRKFMERGLVESTNNPCSSPTPSRSPFTLTSLQKKISQPHPLKDPFSPTNANLFEHQNSSPARSKHMRLDQIAPPKDLSLSNELELCVEVDNGEPVVSNMDAERETGVAYGDSNQVVDENASTTNKDACMPNKEVDIAEKMSVDEVAGKAYFSELENETCDDTLDKNQTDTEQHPEVPRSKLPKGRKAAGVKRTRKAHTRRQNADKPNPSMHEDEVHDDTPNQKHTDTEQQLEVHQSDSLRGRKVAGENHIKKAHPMRKSLAECGTFLENGVRRSKRMKMRPLEYWKGERFLYGRVGESLKLIGVKYFSPGKSSEELKVKAYNIPETSEFKELLELAARH